MSLKGNAESLLSYSKRAFNAQTLEEIRVLAKKGVTASESLVTEARHAGCFDVMDNAEETHSALRKLLLVETLEEAKPLSEKALKCARHARASVDFYKED